MGSGDPDFGNFGDEYVELLAKNRRLQERVNELELMTKTDTLTGLLNRRGFQAAFERSAKRVHRRGMGPLSILTIDLDRFKEINDKFGHSMGDAVLQVLGELLREQARGTDAPARIGGDEFAVLVEGPVAEAEALALRLHWAIRSFRWPVMPGLQTVENLPPAPPENVSVTISCGVAGRRSDEDAWQTLGRADGALYMAKAAGRDTVKTAA